MTQQYQQDEKFKVKIKHSLGPNLKRWLKSEHQRRRRARKRGDQIYFARGFPVIITAEELLAEMNRAKHALLLPPYVKE